MHKIKLFHVHDHFIYQALPNFLPVIEMSILLVNII